MWDLHVREYRGIDDATLEFSNMWGKDSEYFKRALHLIKSSTSEPDEAQRIITLNGSLDLVLESTKDLMDSFASKLKKPTYVLYSVFILIPLALVALMPAITVVGIRFGIGTLVIVYDIILPLFTFAYAEYILMQHPAAFIPQDIPDIHPELQGIRKRKREALILSSVIGLVISSLGYILVLKGNPLNIISTVTLEGIIPPTLFVIWGIVFAVAIYLNITYAPYKKIRAEIRKMENEFSDALFILGRRISEGRSAEEAFIHTASTMLSTAAIFSPLIAGFTIALSEVIAKILLNISDSIGRLPENSIPEPAKISPGNLNQSIPSDLFMFAIGIYIILITVILIRFSGTIEYGG
ncbi:hypothetical protein [uncultured Methanolobus sp.]|uniref:hypothetical protein n=1 Tax=uncultured Methanolobus sp. TaxID=218300 RepID=UPI002AAAE4C2|nr:hypothetical protein [uncultured Methanolobus sp.]